METPAPTSELARLWAVNVAERGVVVRPAARAVPSGDTANVATRVNSTELRRNRFFLVNIVPFSLFPQPQSTAGERTIHETLRKYLLPPKSWTTPSSLLILQQLLAMPM